MRIGHSDSLRVLITMLWLCLAGALSACTSHPGYAVKGSEGRSTNSLQILPTKSVGQTVFATHAGLMGVRINGWRSPESQVIDVRVLNDEFNAALVRRGIAKIDAGADDSTVEVVFDPIWESTGKRFHIEISTTNGAGWIAMLDSSAYASGVATVEGAPQRSQLSFNLVYDRAAMFSAVATEMLTLGVRIFMLTLGLWLFGGLASNMISLRQPDDDLAISIVVRIVAGLCLVVIAALWCWVIGVRLWIPLSAMLCVSVALQARRYVAMSHSMRARRRVTDAYLWALLGVTLAIVIARLFAIRGLTFPNWGDGVHHTMIVRRIVEAQGLFQDWAPYAPIDTLTYHFGFHVVAGLVAHSASISPQQAVLETGQFINVLSCLALFPLGRLLSGNGWGGVLSVALAGVLLPLPADYVNWSRYTQLTAQVILPVLIFLFWRLAKTGDLQTALLCGLLIAGVSLSHYRIGALALAFFVASAAVGLLVFRTPRKIMAAFVLCIAIGAFVVSPWVANSFFGQLSSFVSKVFVSLPVGGTTGRFNELPQPLQVLPITAWAAAGLGAILGLVHRRVETLYIVTGSALCFLMTNPDMLGFQGAGLITNFALLIGAYIPVAALSAGAMSKFGAISSMRLGRLMGVGFILIGVAGVYRTGLTQSTSQYQLVAPTDVELFEWIEQNVAVDEIIGVNSFVAYEGGIVVGSDAGWWLSQIARRKTTVPPMSYVSERMSPGWSPGLVNELHTQVSSAHSAQAAVQLRGLGVRYLYVGQFEGRVNAEIASLHYLNGPSPSHLTLVKQVGLARLYRIEDHRSCTSCF
jgi:hypothetical protein